MGGAVALWTMAGVSAYSAYVSSKAQSEAQDYQRAQADKAAEAARYQAERAEKLATEQKAIDDKKLADSEALASQRAARRGKASFLSKQTDDDDETALGTTIASAKV